MSGFVIEILKRVKILYRVSTKKQYDKLKDDIPMQKKACDMLVYDALKIGIDCYNRGRGGEQTELYAGFVNGEATLYKSKAANLYETVPGEEYSPAGTVLPSEYMGV